MSKKIDLFPRNMLSVAILTAFSAPAFAQSDAPVEEEVMVKGIRASLSRAMDVKRESSGVVDAISAEDIGKFPDTNLAESLQRITGVSIDRVNNEGAKVTVRGFGPDFNLVTLNGRQMPSSSALKSDPISRSFNFNEVAAESVSAVEVHKTGKAQFTSGGIGSTINLATARPLDLDGFTAQVSAKAVSDNSIDNGDDIIDDLSPQVTPEVSGLISQTFADGKFGVLASLSYAKRQYHQERIGIQNGWSTGYPGPTDTAIVDDSAVTRTYMDENGMEVTPRWSVPTLDTDNTDYERERLNGQVVLQFAPTENLTATLDYVGSRFDNKGKMHRTAYWFDNYQEATTDSNGTIIESFRADESLTFWAWEFAFETENDSIGLNLDWDVTDRLNLALDVHDSTSHSNPGLLPSERIANLNNPAVDHDNDPTTDNQHVVDVRSFFNGTSPRVEVDDSRQPGGAYSRRGLQADLYQERGFEVENNIQQAKLDGSFTISDGGFRSSLDFGVENTVYSIDVNDLQEDRFVLGDVVDISTLDLKFTEGNIGFDHYVEYSASEFIDLVDAQDARGNRTVTTDGVEEDTLAYYFALNTAVDIGSMVFHANLGLRQESTDVEATTVGDPVVNLYYLSDSELSQIRLGEDITNSLSSSYDNFLPNADLQLNITDDLVARFSYSETISRPGISALYPALPQLTSRRPANGNPNGGNYQAKLGNVALEPLESTNYDLSLEYYYMEGSYASVAYFTKEVDKFIADGATEGTIEGPNGVLREPSVNPRTACNDMNTSRSEGTNQACLAIESDPAVIWEISQPLNLDSTEVSGLELNIQQMFGDSGFGVIANYTFVDSDDEFDPTTLLNSFAVTGLSDSANLVAFYDKDGFQARIAYNWRDKFLWRTNGSGATGIEPTFTAAYEQIDISLSYEVSENLELILEGINVTDEATLRHGRFEDQLVSHERYGARYAIGASYKF